MSWPDIVTRLIAKDNQLTVEIIVGSIMRKENYLIAIISSNILGYKKNYYTKNFLSLIKIGIIDKIFDNSNKTKNLSIDYVKIKEELRNMMIYHSVMFILKLIGIVIDFVIELTTDIYVNGSYDRLRDWTIYAKLIFREYNELPHIFNERIQKSYIYATKYDQKFTVHMTNLIMRKIIFLFGLCLTFLMILMMYDDRLLSYITLWNRNLFWWASILISCIYFSNILIVQSSIIDESSDDIMDKMIKHTHYCPDSWKNRYNKYDTYDDFKKLFKYKIKNTFYEICSIFIIPYHAYKRSERDLEILAKYIKVNTTYIEGIGCVYKYSVMKINEEIKESGQQEQEQQEQKNPEQQDDVSLIINQQTENDSKVIQSKHNFWSYYK
jgi:autophagy-related protein 9